MYWYEHPNLQCAISPMSLKLGDDPNNFFTGPFPIYRGLSSNGGESAEIINSIDTFGYIENGTFKSRVTDRGQLLVSNTNFELNNSNKFTIITWQQRGLRNGVSGGMYDVGGSYFAFPWYDGSNDAPITLATLKALINVEGTLSPISSTIIPNYGINHFAFVKDSLTLKIYMNGVNVTLDSPTYQGGTWVFSNAFSVGLWSNYNSSGDLANDKVYHWALYNDSLSDSDILQSYNEGHLLNYTKGTNTIPMTMYTAASYRRDKILAIGDSITNRWDYYAKALLPKRIFCYDPQNDIGTDEVIININMDMLQEQKILILGILYWDAHRARTTEQYITALSTILDTIQAIYPSLKIVVNEGIYCYNEDRNNRIVAYNAALPNLIASRSNCWLCPLYDLSVSMGEAGYEDIVHPSPLGGSILGEKVANFINDTFYPSISTTINVNQSKMDIISPTLKSISTSTNGVYYIQNNWVIDSTTLQPVGMTHTITLGP